jgi:hypothetical protein
MACLGCAGVGLPWLFDIWPALIPKLEAPCKTEKLVLSLKQACTRVTASREIADLPAAFSHR